MKITEQEIVCSDAEINGWYSYGFAVEGYIIAGLAIFFPIVLESLAGSVAVESENHGLPCNTTVTGYNCQVELNGSFIPTSTLVFWSSALSTFIQFFIYFSISSFADYSNLRKLLTLIFGYITMILGALLILVTSSKLWWMAYLIFIISGVTVGTSFVFHSSFLPILTRLHPDVVAVSQDSLPEQIAKESEKVGNHLSSRQAVWSIIPGIIQLILGMILTFFVDAKFWESHGFNSFYGLQITIAFSCIWGLVVLSCYTVFRLRNRQAPEFPKDENMIFFSFKKFYTTFKHAQTLPQLFKFLVGYLLFADGYNTIASTAIIFSQVQLNASQLTLQIAGTVTPIAGIIGVLFSTWIQKKIGISTRKALIIQACLYSLLPAYGLLFLKHEHEIIPVAVYHGVLLGAAQSTVRVLYSELLPPGNEAEFFGLFSLADRGSAWIGPFVVGAIRNSGSDLRVAFWFILAQFLLPLVFFVWLDEKKGKKDALEYSQKFS